MNRLALTVFSTMVLVSFSAISSNAEFQSSGNFFDDFDADNDGRVSQSEFSGPEGHFSQLDTDGNGYIDSSEDPAGPPDGDHAGPGLQGEGPGGGPGRGPGGRS